MRWRERSATGSPPIFAVRCVVAGCMAAAKVDEPKSGQGDGEMYNGKLVVFGCVLCCFGKVWLVGVVDLSWVLVALGWLGFGC